MGNEIIICKNCGNHFYLKFCNNCGQKSDTHRITWKELFHHLPHAIFHLDEGFFYTIKQLIIRPGHALREYLLGKRKYFFNPFLMLILVTTLCTFLYVYFHFNTIIASVRLDKLEQQNIYIAHSYLAIRNVFFCLVCSIGDYLIF